MADQLRTPEEMAAYLDAWLAEAPDDAPGIARALGDIARARGMSEVARESTGPAAARRGGVSSPEVANPAAPHHPESNILRESGTS